jgi:hypothetical protein
LQIQRDTTSLTAASGYTNQVLVVQQNTGVNDGTTNWVLGVYGQTSGQAGGFLVSSYVQGRRNAGATDGIISGVTETLDATDQASSVVGKDTVIHEFDIDVNKADNATNGAQWGGFGVRYGLHIVIQRWNTADTTQTEVRTGIDFSTQPYLTPGANNDIHSNFDSLITVQQNMQMFAGLDDRGSVIPTGYSFPVATVTMQQGHAIDFNGSANTAVNQAPSRYLTYTGSALAYVAGASTVFTIPDSTAATVANGLSARSGALVLNAGVGGVAINGYTDGSLAAAGYVGQVIKCTFSGVNVPNATNVNLTTCSLGAGDWDVSSQVLFTPTGTAQLFQSGVSAVSATFGSVFSLVPGSGSTQASLATATTQVILAATATQYVVGYSAFSSGTVTASGFFYARRMR